MIRVGLWGCGGVSGAHRRAYDNLEKAGVPVKLVALCDINKENSKVEILPKKDVKFDIEDQEEISKKVKMLDKLNEELLEKNKKFEEMYSLKDCDDENQLKALQNIQNEIKALRDKIFQKQAELSFLKLRAEKANSLV